MSRPDGPRGAEALDEPAWLDVHFEACRPEYEAQLRSAGFQPGWRVLDAGCGGGSFLPTLCDVVGPEGCVDALDLSSANVQAVRARLEVWAPPCPVEPREGSVRALPYPDGMFDGVWCASTTQHFTDAEMPSVLAELRRVVRPGGLVAIKDVDMALWRLAPADPLLIATLARAGLRAPGTSAERETQGALRGRTLRTWLAGAGLEDVWQRTILIERWAPFRPVERQLWSDWVRHLSALAEVRGLAEDERAAWRAVADPEAPDHPLNRPDGYVCEGHAVAVGTVPSARGITRPQ